MARLRGRSRYGAAKARAFPILAPVLCALLCIGAASAQEYDRRDWMPSGWEDADGDCQDTRAEVLIRDAVGPVTLSADGCRVVAGEWVGPYTARVFTDPRELDIDHVVALAHTHAAGGWAWSPEKKRAYAQWMPGLVAVEASANRRKGAKGPDQWMPEIQRCWYATVWRATKSAWGLLIGSAEDRTLTAACDPAAGS